MVEKNYSTSAITKVQHDEVKQCALQQYLATAFILSADHVQYGKLIEDLQNTFLQGNNNYLKTLNAAYTLLANWKQDPQLYMRLMNDNILFTNFGKKQKNDDEHI
jgi:hypothetical protein